MLVTDSVRVISLLLDMLPTLVAEILREAVSLTSHVKVTVFRVADSLVVNVTVIDLAADKVIVLVFELGLVTLSDVVVVLGSLEFDSDCVVDKLYETERLKDLECEIELRREVETVSLKMREAVVVVERLSVKD